MWYFQLIVIWFNELLVSRCWMCVCSALHIRFIWIIIDEFIEMEIRLKWLNHLFINDHMSQINLVCLNICSQKCKGIPFNLATMASVFQLNILNQSQSLTIKSNDNNANSLCWKRVKLATSELNDWDSILNVRKNRLWVRSLLFLLW